MVTNTDIGEGLRALAAIAMLIFVSAITPGPNNLVVLRLASAGGPRAALAPIAGIVLGGAVMIGLAQWGLASLLHRLPHADTAIVILGGAYLAWLGFAMGWRHAASDGQVQQVLAPTRPLGLFAFQFANPKAWTLALTAAGAFDAMGPAAQPRVPLVAVFAVISVACLIAWAVLGGALARWLSSAVARRRFDRLMGSLLLGSAVALLAGY